MTAEPYNTILIAYGSYVETPSPRRLLNKSVLEKVEKFNRVHCGITSVANSKDYTKLFPHFSLSLYHSTSI